MNHEKHSTEGPTVKRFALLSCALTLAISLTAHEASARPGGGRARAARPNAGAARPNGNLRTNQAPSVNRPTTTPGGVQAGNRQLSPRTTDGNRAFDGGRFDRGSQSQRGDATPQQLDNFLGTRRQTATDDGQLRSGRFADQRENADRFDGQRYDTAHDPFSPGWYADHPNAWHYNYPHADAWAAASWGMAAGSLGYAATTAPVAGTSVYISNTEETSPEQQAQVDEATQLADQGSQFTDESAEWLPLGVYKLQADEHTPSSITVQLAISREGTIRGNDYDASTDTTEPIQGSLDRPTQRVAWRVGDDATVYEAQLYDLTNETTPVWLHSPDGRTQQATLIRIEQNAGTSTPTQP